MLDLELERDPPGDDLLAGEYVLGVLGAQDRRAVQARIERDGAFAALVSAWERRFAPWCDAIAPVAVPPHVWLRIRTQLGWSPVEGRRARWWDDVRVWRAAAALATAAALAVVWLGRVPAPQPTAPPVVVAPPTTPPGIPDEGAVAKPVTPLVADDGDTAWLATVDPVSKKVLMVPVPSEDDAQGRVAELWLIPPGEAPKSLGLLDRRKAHSLPVPGALEYALKPGAVLAVTLEPQGGAPGGVPTGPIIAKGDIKQI